MKKGVHTGVRVCVCVYRAKSHMHIHTHTVTPVIVEPWQSFAVPVRLLANLKRPSSVSTNRLCYDARGSARLKSLRRSKSDSVFCDV